MEPPLEMVASGAILEFITKLSIIRVREKGSCGGIFGFGMGQMFWESILTLLSWYHECAWRNTAL